MEPEQQREMDVLMELVDKELNADRAYFRRRTKRCHRVRKDLPQRTALVRADDSRHDARPI